MLVLITMFISEFGKDKSFTWLSSNNTGMISWDFLVPLMKLKQKWKRMLTKGCRGHHGRHEKWHWDGKTESDETDGRRRRSSTEMIRFLRRMCQPHIVAQEQTFEKLLLSFTQIKDMPTDASSHVQHKSSSEGPLVYRFFGPSGTGKSSLACFVAGAMYTGSWFNPEICLKETIDQAEIGAHVIYSQFRHSDSSIHDRVIKEANDKLSTSEEGIVLILTDFSLANRSVWSALSSFIKQENMKKSIVIFTDDLTPDPSSEFKPNLHIHLTSAMAEGDALEAIENEIKRVYPEEFHEISNHDIWLPFLPIPARAIESLVERVCFKAAKEINEQIDHYYGKLRLTWMQVRLFTNTNNVSIYEGRLLCDMKSKIQASIKLDSCVMQTGAKAIVNFEEAFMNVLHQRKYCSQGDSHQSLQECVTFNHLPVVSIAFEVIATNPHELPCSVESMKEWITFRKLIDV
jgi:hypothetical protein